jgi:ankyrin repeat protein
MTSLDEFSVWCLAREGCAETFTEKLLTHKHELDMVEALTGAFTGTPLSVAAEYGRSEIVQICLENGANPNTVDICGRTPLYHAMTTDGLGATMSLLRYKADVSIPDKFGITPLVKAIEKDLPGLVMLLVENGADMSAKNMFGETSLHMAASKGFLGCFTILIEKGADLCATDCYGKTVLHVAAEKGSFGCIKILMDKGCNINCLDNYGVTPLHAAIRNGKEDSVRILIQYDADPLTTDFGGETPLGNALARECAVHHPSHKAVYRRPWSTIRILVQEEIAWKDRVTRREAIAMSQHERLGGGSRLYQLDQGVLGMLAEYV